MIKNIVFDYGNVLIDWNPRYLFLEQFNGDEDKCLWFMENVCNREWFTRMDSGESMESCILDLQKQFPEYSSIIALWQDCWFDMCKGEINGMFELIQELKGKGYGIFGLSNWPATTFNEARKRFRTMASIDKYVISSHVNLVKPGKEIYQHLLSKYSLEPSECVFIDDREENINGARSVGMKGIVFPGTCSELCKELYPMLKQD